MTASLGYWLLWVAAGIVALGIVLAVATRRVRVFEILTPNEWRLAAQIVGIVVMMIIIIYFQNGHRYDEKAFIYGRF